MTRLVALHGQSMNGAILRDWLGFLEGVEIVCPDAPHVCSEATVDRLYDLWDRPRLPPPHLAWWDAIDDGRVYRGWKATVDYVAPLLEDGPVQLLGFSQGAILAGGLVALSVAGELPPIERAVLVAGFAPRSDLLSPYLDWVAEVPSLHVWGEADPLAFACDTLVELFDPTMREVVTWDGGHEIPREGPAAEAIARFVRRP